MRLYCRLIFALAMGLMAGCGNGAGTLGAAGLSTHPAAVSGVVAATRQITRLATAWQAAYAATRWRLVGSGFARSGDAGNLIGQMVQWHRGHIAHLTIVPTYVHQLAPDRFVGTLRFSNDPRATPVYMFYVFTVNGTQVQVEGIASALQGSDYAHVHWSVTRTAHFVVFHSPYEIQGSDRQYLADLEYQRTQVERKFGVTLPPHASYYLYPDTAQMNRLTGGSCGGTPDIVGCTDPFVSPPTIQTSLWPTYHEPIHVYQLAFEPPVHGRSVLVAPLFIAEGMAVALEDRTADPRLSDYCSVLVFVPLDACAQIAVRRTSPSNLLRDTGFRHADPGDAYSLAGSFSAYLIEHYGYRKYGTFYYRLASQPRDTVGDYNVATSSVYHRSITLLLRDWQHALCAHGCG